MKKAAIIFSILAFVFFGCKQALKQQKESTSSSPTAKIDISDNTNTLNKTVETLQLKYIVWACVCPNWITITDFEKHQNEALGEHCIFIEPANEDLNLPSDFDPFKHFIQVTGQFYTKPDYPKGTVSGEQQPINKAKVFRYTKIEILKNEQIEEKRDSTELVKFNLKYQFQDFPTKIHKGKFAPLDFTDNPFATDKEYVDFITKGCQENGVNFGGHYTIISKSCGAMCQHIFVIDRISGKIFDDINLTTTDDGNGKWGYLYKPDSKMLIANSEAFTTDSLNYYNSLNGITPEIYFWTGKAFKRIQ